MPYPPKYAICYANYVIKTNKILADPIDFRTGNNDSIYM